MAPQLGVCKLSLTTQLLALTHNWHHVDNGLYRSAQMYGMYVAPLLKQVGIKTIINLRGANPKSSWYEPERQICKNLGIGNSTGLGMAPFLINHPSLFDRWIRARETAIARIRALKQMSSKEATLFTDLLESSYENATSWSSDHPIQISKLQSLPFMICF